VAGTKSPLWLLPNRESRGTQAAGGPRTGGLVAELQQTGVANWMRPGGGTNYLVGRCLVLRKGVSPFCAGTPPDLAFHEWAFVLVPQNLELRGAPGCRAVTSWTSFGCGGENQSNDLFRLAEVGKVGLSLGGGLCCSERGDGVPSRPRRGHGWGAWGGNCNSFAGGAEDSPRGRGPEEDGQARGARGARDRDTRLDSIHLSEIFGALVVAKTDCVGRGEPRVFFLLRGGEAGAIPGPKAFLRPRPATPYGGGQNAKAGNGNVSETSKQGAAGGWGRARQKTLNLRDFKSTTAR